MLKKAGLVTVENRILTTHKGMPLRVISENGAVKGRARELSLKAYLLDKHDGWHKDDPICIVNSEFNKKYCGDDIYLEQSIPKGELIKNRCECYLSYINVEQCLKGKGVGTLMYNLMEYMYLKYMLDINKKSGFIDGVMIPFDAKKTEETKQFYNKVGVSVIKAIDGEDILYKSIENPEELLDSKQNRVFETVDSSYTFMEK